MNSFAGFAAALLMLGNAATPAMAQEFPSKPIRIVVPIVAGGTVDLVARLVAKGLSEEFKQSVIVENRAGGATLIGMRHVARSDPDGYTLLATANTIVSASEFIADANYDPIADFTPITQTCQVPMVLVAHPSLKARTLADFIKIAKARPGEVSNASSGLGSTGYIAAELFSRQANIKLLPVAYKGNSPALTDVVGGQVMSMFDQVSTGATYVLSGKLDAVAVTSKTRSSLLPNVPTVSESGFPGYEDVTFNAILAPKGTPPAVVDRLYKAIVKVLADPDLKKQLASRGIEVMPSESPAAFGASLVRYREQYRSIAPAQRVPAT